MSHWCIPPEWTGETAFLLGGGPSLKGFDASILRGRRVIAINNSWELAPWADVLYFCDEKWWRWYGDKVSIGFQGRYIVTPALHVPDPRAKLIKLTGATGLETDPSGLRHGSNSGYQAINLAYHFGAKRIVLLGYDMNINGTTHWHAGHPTTKPEKFADTLVEAMLPKFPTIVEPLRGAGVEVLNATPGSVLTCWPIVPLSGILNQCISA